jgi:Rad3-related DNA helicase
MSWSLYETKDGKDVFLEPIKFSNSKTQEDISEEVLNELKKGTKIIFIKGVCGTGKSAIALNVAKELNRTSIVVPIKNLQRQYESDYSENKFLKKKNGEKLKIRVITGRQNFKCPFAKENKIEGETHLDDFNDFYNKLNTDLSDESCDNPLLPCKIEIKNKNSKKIFEYLKKNPKIKNPNFMEIRKVKRMSIAPICKYWSPLAPETVDYSLKDAEKMKYDGLNGKKYVFYKRAPGCGYYEQYKSYIDADVLIFNSHKYLVENLMNRKPETDVEVIDECDEFLDNFANQEKINLTRLNFALSGLYPDNEKIQEIIDSIRIEIVKIMKSGEIFQLAGKKEIIEIKKTPVIEILRGFADNNLLDHVECDEENYAFHCDEVAKMFIEFLDETYVLFEKDGKDIIINLVTTNLEKRFKEILEKNKKFVLMSGTIHSEKVLKEIFGMKNFKIIEAETEMPGKITPLKTGKEINCRYDNFVSGRVSRKQFLESLNECIKKAPKPLLIHVTSFYDLPNEEEKEKYGLEIITREKLIELQKKNKHGEDIKKFKNKEVSVLYTTKCNRGIDFPGEVCNSIILTRYPYPDVNSIFWKVLKKNHPKEYNDFYLDKAKRDFYQKIYRGLRFRGDHIFLLSPDSRVFENMN